MKIPCPTRGCEGRLELNPTLYVTLTQDADGNVEAGVYGINYDDVEITCDDNEHHLDRDAFPALTLAISAALINLETAMQGVCV